MAEDSDKVDEILDELDLGDEGAEPPGSSRKKRSNPQVNNLDPQTV